MIKQDIPLTDIGQDRFGRENIVDLFVDSINQVVSTNHSCVVYGIYGKWGDGKSSMMNFIKNRLVSQGKKDGINLVEFNPWLVSNDEALLREFFKTIMTDADGIVREAFKKYGSLAIFASKTIVNAAAPGLGTALAKGIKWAQKALEDGQDSIRELKQKASDAIVQSKKHLVVMIDDVDRLDKEELHTVLRLIRQVADFNNCIYIVAMDVDMVSKSISDYHGKGSYQDGREFIDKIVQVPVTLPQIPQYDMRKLVKEELSSTLKDISEAEQIDDIITAVLPFISTYRELKRYCNQLSFVLPHLKGEVSIQDLCALEAIKMVNADAYRRIRDSEDALRHIVGTSYLLKEDRGIEDAAKNYENAKLYITEGMDGRLKDVVNDTLDSLFSNRSGFGGQEDIDKKRLNTGIYFQKYFTQLVPGNLIPDRELDLFKEKALKVDLDAIVGQLDEWGNKFAASEVKRAALYIVRHAPYGDRRCRTASVMAKALSLCKLAKGLPPYVYVGPEAISSFVATQIIHEYMFVLDEKCAKMNIWDAGLLDETLVFIFETGEMNYCMNLLCSFDNIFGSGVYNGRNVIPIVARRFTELSFDEQFRFSKYLLVTLFKRWMRVDEEGFRHYAQNMFVNPEIPFDVVLNKFIDGSDDKQSVMDFVGLFKYQIPQINERLQGESEDVRKSHAARTYASNYRSMLDL